LGAFREDVKDKMKRQHKFVEEFQNKAMDEFLKLREQLELEMDERFDA